VALSEKLRACAERLAQRPGDAEAVSVLEGLLEAPAERVEAARFLAPAYERSGNDEGLVRVLSLIAADAESLPDRLRSLGQLQLLYRRREAWAALAEVTEKLAWVDPDANRQREAWRAAARLHLERLRDEESGLECWLRVLALEPEDAEARQVVRSLTQGDRPISGAAAALCAQIVSKAKGHPEAQAVLDRLLPPTEALLAALQRFQAATEPAGLLDELHAVALRADALEEVVDAVEAQSELIELPAQVTALLRFAARVREELKQPKQAIVLWNDLLAESPRDVEALEHLARLLGEAGDVKHAAELSVRRAELDAAGTSRLEHFVEAADYFLVADAHEAALTAFNEALRAVGPAVPSQVIAHIQLERGRLLERAGDPAAVGAFAQALDVEAFADKAAQGLERLLAKPMTRAAAARALESHVRASLSPRSGEGAVDAVDPTAVRLLANILSVRAENAASPEQHLELLIELAALYQQLDEARPALGALIRAFGLAPRDERVSGPLERLAHALGANEELLAAYEEYLEKGSDDAQVARRAAQLHETLGNRGEALVAWERAARAAPTDLELLTTFADRCRVHGDLNRLGRALRWQADQTHEPTAKVKLLRALAHLCEDSLADPAGAAHAWEELRELQPNDVSALQTLERLYEQTHHVPRLVAVVARKLELERAAKGPLVAALALKLARLKLEAPADERSALSLLREVLKLEPDNAQAVAALGRLASTPSPLQAEAAALASTALDKLGDYPVVVQILEAQLSSTVDAAARGAILHRVSDLQAGPLGDADLAFLAITRALREVPHDLGILQRCIELADATGAGDELDALLAELAAAQPPGAARAGLFRALARRLAGEAAVAAWSEVLAQLPSDEDARAQLAQLFESGGRLADLAVLQRQRVERASAEERPAAMLALASAQERAGELEEAASTLLSLFALKPGIEALAPLDRVLGALGRHLERAEVLRRLASESQDEQQRTLRLLAQARALLTANEPAQAVNVLGEILSRVPDESRAVVELVALVGDGEVRDHVIQLLQPVFKAPGQERQRAAVLETLVMARDDRGLRHELAALHESIGDFTQAYAGRLRLVRERPEDTPARVALERLARAAHLEEELVEAYDELLDGGLDGAAALSMRETIARLYTHELKRPDLAVRAWERVAKLDRQALAPLAALEELHRSAKDWVRLAGVLQRKAPLLPTPEEQVETLRALALLAEGPLHDNGLAAETYRAILERAPGDGGALRSLGLLLDGFGKHGDAYGVLERQLQVAASEDERAALHLKLGQLAAGPVGRPAEAVEHFAGALHDESAVNGLEALLDRHPSLRPRIAAVLEPLYRSRRATARLVRALELQPTTPERLEELASLREGQKQLPEAFAARQQLFALRPEDPRLRGELERVGHATGQLETVASLFHARLEHRLEGTERLELWRRLGAIQRHLGRRRAAAEAYEEVARLLPMDPAPLEVLCELYREQGLWPKLPPLLRTRAELAPQVEQQVALLLELAQVAEDQLLDNVAAVDACRGAIERGGFQVEAMAMLERLLEKSGRFLELRELLLERGLDPVTQVRVALIEYRALKEDDSALQRLEGLPEAALALQEMMRGDRPSAAKAAHLVERSGPAELLIEALEVQAEWASGEARTALLHRIADLHADDPTRAFEVLDRLLRDAPDDGRAFERLCELAPAAKFERAWARLLGDVVGTASVSTQKVMWPELARLRQGLSDSEGALRAWTQFLELEPTDGPALLAASALVGAAGRWSELSALLERRLLLEPSLEGQLQQLHRIGAVQREGVQDPAAAYDTYRRLLELAPEDSSALEALDALCVELERWPELAEVLGRRIALEADHGHALKLRLARVRRSQLASAAAALPLLGEILQVDPSHAEAIVELEALVEEQPAWEPAEDLLLGAHRRSQDYARLALLLDACAGRGRDRPRRRTLWLELADLRRQHSHDEQLAFLAMARAFRESPGDGALRDRLVELADAAEQNEALAALLDEVMGELTPRGAAEASVTLGELCLGALDEPERAAALFRRAHELDARIAPRALAGLDAAVSKLEQWDALLPVLEARAAAAPDDVTLLMRLGAVAADRLSRDERAIEAYRAVLRVEPKHLDAARALEALYERTGARTALLEILTLLENLTQGVSRAQVRMKMARLCVKDDYERTLLLCRRVLDEDPLHTEAFALLAERLEAGGRWADLEKVLEARLQVTLAPVEAAELGFKLGELAFRRRDDPKKAARHYRAVLERAPRHLGALEALEELYEGTQEQRELAHVLEHLAQLRDDLDQRRAHHLRRAEVLAELNEREGAVEAVRAALDLMNPMGSALPPLSPTPSPAPGRVLLPDARWKKATEPGKRGVEANPVVQLITPPSEPELQRLRKVCLKLAALPEASRTLSLLAENHVTAGRGPKALETFFELADVDERRKELKGATTALERVLALEPFNRTAYDRVRKLYGDHQQVREWASAVERFLPHLDGEELLTALDELAQALCGPLRDPSRGFELALRSVSLDPGSDVRREAAEQLAARLKQVPVLTAAYQQTLQGLAFGPAYPKLALALARLLDHGLDQVDAAEATLKGLLAHDPVNAEALEALAAMFERKNLHTRLVGALELQLEAAAPSERRVTLLSRLALLHEQKLKDPGAAAHALRRLVDAEPSPQNARLLMALHQRHQQWPEVLNALLRVRALVPAGAQRAVVQLEIAALHEQQLKDPEAAVEAYLHALELEPQSTPAFRSLERLYVGLDRPAELLRAYEQRLERTHSIDEKLELQYKSAELWERRGNPLNADKCLDAVVALKPDEVPALEGLARLRRAGSRWRALAETLSRHAAVAGQPLQRAQLCTELAEVQLEHLKDSAAAAGSWAKALEHLPEHRPALRALAQLHEKERRWADAAQLIAREAKLEKQPQARAELEYHRGTLYEDQLRELSAARAAYAAALEAEAVHLPSLRRLRALFKAASEWPAYENNLAHEAKRAGDAKDRYAAGLELARHFEARGASDKATVWYEHALGTRPDALEAALPLCDLLQAAKAWPRAAEVLKVAIGLLEQEKPTRPRLLIDRLCELAQVHRELQQPSLAVHAYARALHLDPTEPKALRAQIEMLEGGGHIAEAAEKLELFLEHHLSSVPRAERAGLALHLGDMYWVLKREKDALAAAERALDVEPQNTLGLNLAIRAADKLLAFEKAIDLRQRLADVSADEGRFKLLLELAALAHDKLGNPTRAIEALSVAQRLQPQSRPVLQQLSAAYRAVGHNRKAAETVQALLQHSETSPADRRKETLALADLYGRAMSEVDRAVEVLERALDQTPSFVEAFQALEALLTRTKEWKKLDAAYARMAQRLGERPDQAPARAALWRGIGELRLKQFKDRAGALQAFEAGVRLQPEGAAALEAYAALAIEFPDRVNDALKAFLRALPNSSDPQRACAAFARIAEKRGDLDTASIATRAAAMLSGSAKAGVTVPRFKTQLSEQGWRELLLHPYVRGPLGDLMALVWEHAGGRYARSASDHRLHAKRHAVDPRTVTLEALQHLFGLGRALGLPKLEVLSPYLAPQSSSRREGHPDDAVGVKVVPTWPPYVVVGERLVNERNLSALYALIGGGLASLRPELLMAQLLDGEALEVMVEAALSLGDGRYVSAIDAKVLKADRKQLEKGFSSEGRNALGIVTEKVLSTRRAGDVERFRTGARLTPLRVALLAAGDLAPVRAQLSVEGEQAEAAVRELLVFALGGELHQLRVETGTTVGGK
jgi:tetratricopeptide (TPR) repeat protein